MPRHRTRIARAVAAWAAFALPSTSSPQSAAATLDRQLDALFASNDSVTTPGCAVGITGLGTTSLMRSYGMANLSLPYRIDTSTVFEAGSVSKQFTAAAILLLSYDGKLSLDDSIRRWLPEISPMLPVIRIRQLLHHESGLRDIGDLLELTGWPRGTRLYGMSDYLALIGKQRTLNFRPGDEYLYSNTNYILAALIVARASGESFSAYTRRAIFEPLGMRNSSWRENYAAVVAHRATGYSVSDEGALYEDMPFENTIGHAGLLTTVPDLLLWQRRFLRDDSAAAEGRGIFSRRFADDMERVDPLASGVRSRYALGLEIDSLAGVGTVSHAGWTAGYRAYVGRVPSRNVGVALLCNAPINTEDVGPVVLGMSIGVAVPRVEPPNLGARVDSVRRGRSALDGLFRNDRTGQPVMVRAFEGGVSLNTWVGFRRVSDSMYVRLDMGRTLRVRRTPQGDVLGFDIEVDGVLPLSATRYSRATPWAPSSLELRGVRGAYQCRELGADLAIVPDSLGLALVRRGALRDHLRPLYADAFDVEGQGFILRVRRDARAAVAGISLTSTRSRDIECARVR